MNVVGLGCLEEVRRRELSEARLALTERWGRDAVARLEAEVLELRARAKSPSASFQWLKQCKS